MSNRRPTAAEPPDEAANVTIGDLSHDGRGVARADGKIVFVPGALPGEEVRARILERHRSFDDAELLEIIRASPGRLAPRCPHYGRCGGCRLQHLDGAAQLTWKQEHLEQTLQRVGKLKPARWLDPVTGPAYAYRMRARFAVFVPGDGTAPALGFRVHGTRRIEPIGSCAILEPPAEALIAPLRAMLADLHAPAICREILVAVGESPAAPSRAICLVARGSPSARDRSALESFAAAEGLALYLDNGRSGEPVRIAEAGDESLHYSPAPGVRLDFQPWHFVQANRPVNRALVRRAIDLLEPRSVDRVLDLYCGLGNFALPLARRAGEVIGVEGDERLLAWARRNARVNGCDNVSFHGADLSRVPEAAQWARNSCDLVLLDPPRSGAAAILATIAAMRPRRICYESCNPATLARDAGTLARSHRFRLEAAGVLDMFPNTSHVESIALFAR